MINLLKDECSGCGACVNICPEKAVFMISDDEGFLYPNTDKTKCTHCNICKKHCPVYAKTYEAFNNEKEPECYAGWALDENERRNGSSGGIFGVLAKHVIDNGGYAAAVEYTQDHRAIHVIIDNLKDLPKLKKSKYLQSDTETVFSDIKALLQKDKNVLFMGTPCQCAGLMAFLEEKPENLLLCDFICHGVNSPLVHQKYIEETEKELDCSITEIDHRDKTDGWENYQFSVATKGKRVLLGGKRKNPFLRGFLTNLYLRRTCYDCKCKGYNRPTDITLGDCWGFTNDNRDGVSLILTHTEKGQNLLYDINNHLFTQKHDFNSVLKSNDMIVFSAKEKYCCRNLFFSKWDNNVNFQKTITSLLGVI